MDINLKDELPNFSLVTHLFAERGFSIRSSGLVATVRNSVVARGSNRPIWDSWFTQRHVTYPTTFKKFYSILI